jgi:hypothetical protein
MPTTAKGEKKFCSLRIIAVIVMEIDVFSIVWNVCFFCLPCLLLRIALELCAGSLSAIFRVARDQCFTQRQHPDLYRSF